MNKFTSKYHIFTTIQTFVCIVLTLLSVSSLTAQCSFSCQESITIALSGRSDREITLEEVLVNTEESCPGGDFSVEVLDETGASIGSSVNYQYIGQILTFVVRENNSMNNCTGQLELTDDTPPILNCTDVFVACHADTSPVAIGYPDFSDNIDELVISDLAYEDRVIDLNCLAEHDGVRVNQRIDRDWWVRDSDGNEAHCTQTIFLKRAALNDIEFPPALDDEARPALNCTDDPTDLQQTGYPTIDARPLMGNEICDFSIDFTDRVTEHCEGSSTTHRIWSIIDLCTAEERRHVQVIERNDNIAPAIRCPDTIYATVHPASCQARVELASALVHDDCGTVTTTVSWAFGTSADAGSAVFENIPFGTHELLYTATDDCGNAASCTAIVVVTDDTKPTTLCDDGMEVSLNDTGEVIAPAELFDNGSSDNCAIASYEASRAGGEYVEQLVFTCEDVARSPIPLTFRVTDVSGNYRECAMEVYIVDTDAPAMTCPADMTIGCEVDYRDTGLTGVATGVDACGIEEITHSDVTQLNACGLGTVTRLWRVKDVNGNVSTCEQRIRITSEDELQVVFPADRSIVGCGAAISPDSLGRPSVSSDGCMTDYGIDYTDNVFGDSPPACYTIYRRWTVVDLCKFVPNTPNTDGIWEHTQVIEIQDNTPPVLQMQDTYEANIFDGGCEMFVELPLPTATDCSPDITYTHDALYADGNGANASGVYPVGEHQITYTATDGCGNVGIHQLRLLVRDEAPPVPICFSGVTIPLGENGQVIITPNMVSAGANDNCFSAEEIELSVTPSQFDCDDLGAQEVTVRAEDPMGNFAICIVEVTIQDNIYNCSAPPAERATVSGLVRTVTGEQLAQVPLRISGAQEAEISTDTNGRYRIDDLPMYQNYSIHPISGDDHRNGISTFDLIKMRKHILGLESLTSPYQLIAGDVNNSGGISTADMITLRKLILGIEDEFTAHPSWIFVNANYEFPSDMFPTVAPYPQSEDINNLDRNRDAVDFVAIKMGDLNGNARLDAQSEILEERSGTPALQLQIENLELETDYEYRIPVYANNFEQIEGFQFTLDYDTTNLEWINITPNALPRLTKDHFYEVTEGQITFSWEYFFDTPVDSKTPLFTLHFTAKRNTRLQEELRLTASHLRPEAYTYDEEILDVELNFTTSEAEFYLLQNAPNPFRDATMIYFTLPSATPVTLSIYDLHGRLIQQHQKAYSAGPQGISIHLHDSPARGILYYTLTTPITRTISGKMLRIKE